MWDAFEGATLHIGGIASPHAMRLLVCALLTLTIIPSCDSGDPPTDTLPIDRAVGCDGQEYPSLAETPYVLPFPEGASYTMRLGNCSSSYHGPGQPDRYAYDFAMEIGTPITAARAGEVVHVVESGEDGGFPNNIVVARHADDTFALYMHLTKNGADVEVGDTVQRGDRIGRSGNTGLAGYPHLHFIVTRGAWAYPYEPMPVSFSNASPSDLVLAPNRTYTATAP